MSRESGRVLSPRSTVEGGRERKLSVNDGPSPRTRGRDRQGSLRESRERKLSDRPTSPRPRDRDREKRSSKLSESSEIVPSPRGEKAEGDRIDGRKLRASREIHNTQQPDSNSEVETTNPNLEEVKSFFSNIFSF